MAGCWRLGLEIFSVAINRSPIVPLLCSIERRTSQYGEQPAAWAVRLRTIHFRRAEIASRFAVRDGPAPHRRGTLASMSQRPVHKVHTSSEIVQKNRPSELRFVLVDAYFYLVSGPPLAQQAE